MPPDRPAPTPKRRPARKVGIVVAGLIASAAIGYGWLVISTRDEPSTSAPSEPAPPSNELAIEPQDVSNPLVVPIDDASEVVAEINDNSEETEALDLLGLDETGNTVAAGHRLTWSSGTGHTITITVDAATGNYAVESSDGFEWRRIDGTSYGRSGDMAWSQVDGSALESVPRLGLDGPVTIDQILDPLIGEYSSTVTDRRDDGTSTVNAEVDSYALWNDHPDQRLTWLALMGVPNPDQDVAPGSIIVVAASVRSDGRTVDNVTVTTPTLTSTYFLNEVFDTAPVIEVPEL